MQTIQITKKENFGERQGANLRNQIKTLLDIETGRILHTKVFAINYSLDDVELEAFAKECLQDVITDEVFINRFDIKDQFLSYIAVAKLPGVTDDEGSSAQMALADFLNAEFDLNTQHIFSQDIYYFEKELTAVQLQNIAVKLLANPLINKITVFNQYQHKSAFKNLYVPIVNLVSDDRTEYIDLNISDEALLSLSQKMVLALNLEEMLTIKNYFNRDEIIKQREKQGLQSQPTDCELEILAQTWSEHCKHKEFNAIIDFKNLDTGKQKKINSLFKTYIQGATSVVQKSLEAKNNHWLIKVFSDNAGVVQATKDLLFVWKVETHNSPSALDPYGGAITGILGCNRDAIGTGIGGAKLFFNTNVLCFGPPNYSKPLLKGQLHPRQIMDGVIKGIEDGGNKSGVPTVNGAILFDDDFAGKPLVYCGTGALMPNQFDGKDAWEKPIDPNDFIVMAGGRVGKDGIHGATFSSVELDEHSPQSAVQIGSPITQKKLADFMAKAATQGLIKSSTDNGAGGLSSSVGELAEITNGAIMNLEKVPLKYSGLKPWEIFVSESQERMTLVVEPHKWAALLSLAKKMEVEVTHVGDFTDSGFLDVRMNGACIAYIDMEFLHDGVPQKKMIAEWKQPFVELFDANKYQDLDLEKVYRDLLADFNIRSRESVIRQYDHEVQGKSIVKPLMGNGRAPQDAAVLRFGFDSYEGIAVSNGISPRFGDLDPYEMSCGAFDEGIRQIISVGGELPNRKENDDIFWSVNDNFCVPDSEFHPENNVDGKEKLAKLVLMAEGLYDMATFFDIPLTSGKDSMKNDFKADGVKISIPPTILYSMTAKVKDVRKVVTSDFKQVGHLIYQLGETFDEMGRSSLFKKLEITAGTAPKVNKQAAKDLYLKVMDANRLGLIASSHDLSDGGLAITLAESAMDSGLGAVIDLDGLGDLPDAVKLFSESHSRFLVTVCENNQIEFEKIFGSRATKLGDVGGDEIKIKSKGKPIISESLGVLLDAWTTAF